MDMFSALQNSFFPYFMCYLSFMMTFMFSITSSQGMLFGFTDLDMLRSFPLKEDANFLKSVTRASVLLVVAKTFVIPNVITVITKAVARNFLFNLFTPFKNMSFHVSFLKFIITYTF